MSFAALIDKAQRNGAGLTLEVPETWYQGRTAYGGFSSALTLVAAQQAGGEGLPPLRSAQMAMMAPVAGRIEVQAKVERKGRNATWVSATIHGERGLAFSASFVFMGAVESALHLNAQPLPEQRVPVEAARAVAYTRHTPAFLTNNFECRHGLPQAEQAQPAICRWVRLSGCGTLDPMVEMLLVGDALPPGVMPMLHAGVPVSTMHWQAGLLTPAPRTQDGWWLLHSAGDYAGQGCSNQRMAIWNSDGEPAMAGTQSIALFG